MTQNEPKLLIILSGTEIEELYGKPTFEDDEERAAYLTAPPEVMKMLQALATSSAIYFILQWGYFKMNHRFYDARFSDVGTDIKFLIKKISAITYL